MSYIEIHDVRKSFGDHEVLRGINMQIEEHEFVSFLGSSGCGKTTLRRCIVGLESVDSGRIYLDRKDITDVPAKQRGISMIFQQYSLFPTMNLYQNVSFGLRMQKLPKPEIDERVDEVLDIVNMREHKSKYPYQLSGGEQQRAALARALIMNPKVLLLDEPFSAIDAKLRKELQVYLKDIHRRLGMTSIFVTHDQEEAMRMSDKVHLFNEGILEQSDTPYEIYAHPKTPFVASFIGSYNLFDEATSKSALGIEGKAAIRPELILVEDEISSSGNGEDALIILKGSVVNCIPQGSIVRYVVKTTNGAEFKVDKVFTSESHFQEGDSVRIGIPKDELIVYRQ